MRDATAYVDHIVTDPLYTKIVAGLEKLCDGDKFEACANSLLREKYPWLTWIKGGSDAGFDGVGVDEPRNRVQLITTTQDDVIGNLTNSLERSKAEGRTSDLVLVATSRGLSPERRDNIEKRITEFGKFPLPIETQPNIAELLYHSPRWRKELLGISGNPPPLSRFPVSDRTYLPLAPIGRDEELKRLTTETGDLVVFGQPGCGKTHLLAHAASTSDGLFLAATDAGIIADGIREQGPQWIIVDDAFSRLALLTLLRRIRQEIGAVFRIVAVCWPGQHDDVAAALDVLGQRPVELTPLPQPDIKKIVVAAGISGPDSLLRELLHQAAGKPGLAVTLARLCLLENVREVVAGRALARDVKRTLTLMAGRDAVGMLGFFALAGGAGLDVTSAAKASGIPPGTARQLAESMGAAGVLEEIDKNRLAVEPARLRQALVAETFCQPGASLDWAPLLDVVPDRGEALTTVICAGLLGERLDEAAVRREIVNLAKGSGDIATACDCYAQLGREQSLWIFEHFPQLVEKIAEALLLNAPREALPPLIQADFAVEGAFGNSRERLKSIREWIDAVALRPETIQRRELLLDALVVQAGKLKASSTLLIGLGHVFSLRFEWISTPPGQAAAINIQTGAVRMEFMSGIAALWKKALPLLGDLPASRITAMLEVIQDWFFPIRLSEKLSPEHLALCQKYAAGILADLCAAYEGKWAILRQFDLMASSIGVTLPDANDEIVTTLFPKRAWEDEREQFPAQEAAAKALAASWTAEGPRDEIVGRWLACDAEAREAGVNYPNLGESVVAHEIAQTTQEKSAWFNALLARRAPVDLLAPFAWCACRENEPVLTVFVQQFIDDETYGRLAANCLLQFSRPGRPAWASAAKVLARHADGIGRAVRRNQLPTEVVLWLFQNGDAAIKRELAANLWSAEPKGEIADPLRDSWALAVVEDLEDDYQWDTIAKKHPDLARAWLMKRVNQTYEDRVKGIPDFTNNRHLAQIIRSLGLKDRREVIDAFTEGNYHSDVLALLVGGDLDLLRHALERPATKNLARSCLGSPGKAPHGWVDRVVVLFEHGLSVEEVFQASHSGVDAWIGAESVHFEGVRAAYEPFAKHPDGRVRELCWHAEIQLAAQRDASRKLERIAAVRGEFY